MEIYKLKIVAALMIGILWIPNSIFAQTVPVSVEERIRVLEQELALLKRTVEAEREINLNKNKTSPIVTAGAGKEGFSLKSADGNFKLRVGGYVHADGRYFLDSREETGTTDTFLLRRVRPLFEGTVYKYFDFRIMPDFGGGTTTLADAYADINYRPELKLRAGKFKEPGSLERLQSINNATFVELGYPTSLMPNRDIGAQIFGDLFNSTLNYSVGIFDGAADGGNTDIDTNNDKDIAARIFAEPFKNSDIVALSGLGFGAAATYGESKDKLPTYRSSSQATIFSYASSTTSDGALYRFNPQSYYYNGPFGFLGEYAYTSQDVSRTTATDRIGNQGWNTTVSYVLTGEKASYGGVKPIHAFLEDGGMGAFEVAARLSGLHIDTNAFSSNFANASTSVERAAAWALGLNWYLNSNVRWMFDFEQTNFRGGGGGFSRDRETENALLGRLQAAF